MTKDTPEVRVAEASDTAQLDSAPVAAAPCATAPVAAPAPAAVPVVYLSYPHLSYTECPDYMGALQRACASRLHFFDPGVDCSSPQRWATILQRIQAASPAIAVLPDGVFKGLNLPLTLFAPPGQEQIAWGLQLTYRAHVLRSLYVLLRSKAVLADAMLPGRGEQMIDLLLARLCDIPILAVSEQPSLSPQLGYLASAVVTPTDKLLPDLLNFYVGYSQL